MKIAKNFLRIKTEIHEKKSFSWSSMCVGTCSIRIYNLLSNFLFPQIFREKCLVLPIIHVENQFSKYKETNKQTKLVCDKNAQQNMVRDLSLFVYLFICSLQQFALQLETPLLNFRWNIEKCLIAFEVTWKSANYVQITMLCR